MSVEDLGKIFNFKKNVQKIWHTPFGLFVTILFVTYIYSNTTRTFFSDLKISFPSNKGFISNIYFGIYALILIVILFIWWFNRKLPKFHDRDIGILFCFSEDENLFKISFRLKRSLQNELKHFNLKFKIRNLPPNIKISDKVTAHKVRKLSNAYLIIWGPFESGNIEKKKVIGFTNINFTFKRPFVKDSLMPYIYAELGLGIVGKQWYIDPDNNFFDINLLSHNITEASLNIIGKALLISHDYDKAIEVLKLLLTNYLLMKDQEGNPLMKTFTDSVKGALSYAYCNKCIDLYYKDVFPKLEQDISEEIIRKGFEAIDSAIKINNKNGDFYSLRAIFYHLMGKLEFAIDDISKNRQFSLKANGAPHLSAAFLYFFSADLKKGLRQYSRAFQKEIPLQTIKEVVIFIEKTLKKYPEKIQLHLALGIINKKRLNLNVAKKELKKFIEMANKQNIFRDFIPVAQKLLSKIK